MFRMLGRKLLLCETIKLKYLAMTFTNRFTSRLNSKIKLIIKINKKSNQHSKQTKKVRKLFRHLSLIFCNNEKYELRRLKYCLSKHIQTKH